MPNDNAAPTAAPATIERRAINIKGFDCRGQCNDPRHVKTYGKPYASPGEDHGQHSDEWWYGVIFTYERQHFRESTGAVIRTPERAAGTLVVCANEASAVARRPGKAPEGVTLGTHVPWRLTEDDVREARAGTNCEWIDAPCFGDVGFNVASELFAAHGVPKFEQPEALWQALEAWALSWITASRASAAEFTLARCTACEGKGVVPRR